MKEIITIITVLAFAAIVFRRKILPVIRKRKDSGEAGKPATQTPAQLSPVSGYMYSEVLAFDVSGYESLMEMSETIALQVTKKLDYINTKGKLLTMDYLAVGNVLIILLNWQI